MHTHDLGLPYLLVCVSVCFITGYVWNIYVPKNKQRMQAIVYSFLWEVEVVMEITKADNTKQQFTVRPATGNQVNIYCMENIKDYADMC